MKKPIIESPFPINNASNLIQSDTPLLQTYVQAATSDNTRKAYQSDIRQFIASGGLLPSSTENLLYYLQAQANQLNPRTLKRRLVAIKQWHVYQGFPDPTSHPLIKKTLSGIFHVHGTPAQKASPLSLEQLLILTEFLTSRGRISDWRDNALLQIGFFGAFRRSELVAIQWESVNFVPQGVEILISRSKTDQSGEGTVCAIPYGNIVLCPVRALQQWQKASQRTIGSVFAPISKKGTLASRSLSPARVNNILKNLATACQLPQANLLSGHSFRRGFATTATQKGASMGAIMRQGRWRHEATVHGYIEEGKRFERNAAGTVLSELDDSNLE